MVRKIFPKLNEIIVMKTNALIHVIEGVGEIQVDFKNYSDWSDRAIFLEKGQYIKFLNTDFAIRLIEFGDNKFYDPEVRVLFKHLISLGYIDILECDECKRFLNHSVLSNDVTQIIDVSAKQWYWQNPFGASKSEYQIIFDMKDVIDSQFADGISVQDLLGLINNRGYDVRRLLKDKVGVSVKNLLNKKVEAISKKHLAFTDKNVQEIAFDLGFSDPAYFNKVFKWRTGETPSEFRRNFDFEQRDTFVSDITELLKAHHYSQRSIRFYAEKMNLSIPSVSKKVSQKMNTSLGKLIRWEVLNSAKLQLLAGETVASVAHNLGFKESNHFSRFFKTYTDKTPLEFVAEKKYND